MEKNDPSLVPEWYRTGGMDATKTSKHHRRSSSMLISDNIGFLGSPRARSLVSTSAHDASQSYFSTDTHSNSSDSNSLMNGSSPYRSFNNKRYQDKRREKKIVNPDKRSSTGLSNGYTDYSDTTYKDTDLRSDTKVHGGLSISESKCLNNGLNNGVIPGKWSNGIQKSSFENDFPSLQKEENVQRTETTRKTLSLSLDTSSITTSTKECTSSLTDAPSVIGDIQQMTSSAEQTTHGPTTSSGLSMAEALAKGPSLTQTVPQPSLEIQRLNELAIKQSRQLIPVTPTTPKSSVVSDRLRVKAVRTVPPKVLPQLPSQSANNLKCGFTISDSPKHQGGNFHVLNREKNNSIPATNKIIVPQNGSINSDIASPKFGAPTDNPMCKTDKIQNTILEKRHLTQDRIRFFNNIRNGSSASNKSGGQTAMANVPSVFPTKGPENCNGMDENCSALIKPKNIDEDEDEDEDEQSGFCLDSPTEEEREFFISLGWREEDAEKEESLTAKEIDDFFKKYHVACLERNINISAAVRRLENLPFS